MRQAITFLSVFTLLFAATGCTVARFYSGTPLRAEPAALVEGESTKAEVLRLFGPPDQITHQTDGDAFVYRYLRRNFSSITLQEPLSGQRILTYRRQFDNRDTLVVLFDFAGMVRGVAFARDTESMPPL